MKPQNETRDFNPFNRIQVEKANHNLFDLSYDNKLTLDMGGLYPVMVQDTLPGDSFTITPEMLIRFAPMTFPIMHRIDATIHFFYVPNRILWKNWEKFLAGEDFSKPYFQGSDVMGKDLPVSAGSIYDYMGLPISTNIKEKIDAFPFLAYLMIYNQYYQDQNNDSTFETLRNTLETLQSFNGLIEGVDLGLANYEAFPIMPRSFEHDYFTSALPFAQKGDPVNIPLTLGNIPVEIFNAKKASDGTDLPENAGLAADGTNSGLLYQDGTVDTFAKLVGEAIGADAELTGTINQLRIAMQLQKFLELNARSGTRYNELIRAHFPGVNIGDARINRPEYIGGIKNNVVISEVLQTGQTTDDSALGEYAGHGTAVVGNNSMSFYCPEHGYIIGMLSVIPKTAYYQGIPRKLSRNGYLDYYWREFAHIGEQAIENKEVYYDNADTHETNIGTFGYIPRWSEYKYNPSETHGDFRTTLFDFTLTRKFDSRPALNQEFIYVNPAAQKHIFAVDDPDVNSLYAHIFFNVKAKRMIPFFTNPGGI